MSCFHCRNHRNAKFGGFGVGYQYDCAKGHDTSKVITEDDVMKCPDADPQFGFQIGGYYRHMWFEGSAGVDLGNGVRSGGCLEWFINGNEEYPNRDEYMQFHLCDWHQLEEWVEFWGKELRRRGWVVDSEVSDVD